MKELLHLPDDVIISHALPSLPTEVLLNFKRVCKEWLRRLSEDSDFLDKQVVLATAMYPRFFFSSSWPGGFIYRFLGVEVSVENIWTQEISFSLHSNNILSLSNSNMTLRLMGSCNGLVLLRRNMGSTTIYVVNPTLRESITLPHFNDDPVRINVAGIGYDTSSKKYKVVVLFCDNESLLCRILTLGSTTWREISTPAVDNVTRLVNPAIVTNGFLHFGCHGGWPWHVDRVLSVDMCTELVIINPIPFKAASLWKYQDKVAATMPTNIGFLIHTMHYHVGGAVKTKLEDLRVDINNRRSLIAIGSFKDGQVLIFKECPKMRLWFYNTKSELFTEIETPWQNNEYAHMRFFYYEYVSTLVSPVALAGVGGNNGDEDPDIQQ